MLLKFRWHLLIKRFRLSKFFYTSRKGSDKIVCFSIVHLSKLIHCDHVAWSKFVMWEADYQYVYYMLIK